jgi:hypothetical protein
MMRSPCHIRRSIALSFVGQSQRKRFSEPSDAIAVKRIYLSTFSTHATGQIWFGMKLALNSLGLKRHGMRRRVAWPIWRTMRYPAQSVESLSFGSVPTLGQFRRPAGPASCGPGAYQERAGGECKLTHCHAAATRISASSRPADPFGYGPDHLCLS